MLDNPPIEWINGLRTVNVVVGFVAVMVMLLLQAKPRWHSWTTQVRFGWLALFMLCVSGTYGTFEVRYLDTFFRVPMVTVSLIWALLSALWPWIAPRGLALVERFPKLQIFTHRDKDPR